MVHWNSSSYRIFKIRTKTTFRIEHHWRYKAATQEHKGAQVKVGLISERKEKFNSEECLRWYRKATEKGNKFALTRLGDFYLNRYHMGKDFGKAHWLYLFAAMQGNAPAKTKLGSIYKDGKFVVLVLRSRGRWQLQYLCRHRKVF